MMSEAAGSPMRERHTSGEDEVVFVDATDAVDELLADPDLAGEARAVRDRMREADRVHAMTLAMVRHAAGLTQVELAKALNVSQGAVARTEGRGDMLLSTLKAYLEAADARAVLLVELADGTMAQISLDEASAA
jgi:DNA-binding XRE family transcriptional regulator